MKAMKRTLGVLLAIGSVFACLPQPACGADQWTEVRSSHFRVVGNAGEKSERRVAQQFEEMRALFQRFLTSFRVDSGKPFVIIALKNEDSMKTFLPDYWAAKDRARPAGMFLPAFDEDLAIVRTDATGTGENAYHLLYHEYTHAVMRLNVSSLPVWLNEGLAEFYGNTIIGDRDVQIGGLSARQLNILQRSPLIPIDQLMNADERSPLYNERDQATMFYSESWAIVHYLMLDPQARKQNVFSRYLKAWLDTRDGVGAARSVFGDLKKFQEQIDRYARQSAFYVERGKLEQETAATENSTRALTAAEVMVVQADFLFHTAHVNDARRLLEQALEQQPNLASAHVSMGMLQYSQYTNDDSEKELARGAELDPRDFRPFYYRAQILLRTSGYSAATTPQIVFFLEKALELNPTFAPTQAFLSEAYRQRPETREKALEAAKQANHLSPAVLAYAADVGFALMALNRGTEARSVGEQIDKAAHSPQEKAVAQAYTKRLAHYEEMAEQKPKQGLPGALPAEMPTNASDGSDEGAGAAAAASRTDASLHRTTSAVTSDDGLIQEVDCNTAPVAKIKFAILGKTLALAVSDVARIEIRAGGKTASADASVCSQWSGRKAKITYKSTNDNGSDGDVIAIDFP